MGIAVGGGSVWVGSDAGVIRIARDRPRDAATVPLGNDVRIPTALAFGEGAVWVVGRPAYSCCRPRRSAPATLTRIDPATNDVETITIGGNPAGVAVGAGSVWVADPATRSVIRVNADTEQVTRIPVGGRPRGIAVGAGLVWVSVG